MAPSVFPKPPDAVGTQLTSTDEVRAFIGLRAPASSPALSASAAPVSFAPPRTVAPLRKRLILLSLAACLAGALLLVWQLRRADSTATAAAASANHAPAAARVSAPPLPASAPPLPLPEPERPIEEQQIGARARTDDRRGGQQREDSSASGASQAHARHASTAKQSAP